VTYDIRHTITLVNDGTGTATRILLWVVVLRDIAPYQEVLSMEMVPLEYETVTDEYDNLYALFEFNDVASGESVAVELQHRVAINELDFDLGDCEGAVPSMFVDPELHVESDAKQVVALAEELAEGRATACDKVRAFYNYVGDKVSYTGYDPADRGALLTLESLTGDCTDFADLLIALSRAAGIPARLIGGVTCCTYGGCAEGDIKHDWLEVYLPGTGWVPMDPAWGRFPTDRETYFAGMTPDHIVVTLGQNRATLEGYRYYYFEYWWEAESTEVLGQEEWRIVRVGE